MTASIRRLLASTAAAIAFVIATAVPPATALAAESIALPFAGGQAVRVIQGYAGGTHVGRSHYGLDLVLASGPTSGAPVLAPADGTVAWAYAPGTRNGCIAIALRGGEHSVMLCHVVLSRAFQRGEAVARGQTLGTVGAPGTVGNNGTPHVHLELHRGGLARSPVPFSPPGGLLLDGRDLPASGARNQHGALTIVSSNGSRSPAPEAAAPASTERASPSTRSPVRPARVPQTAAPPPAPPPPPKPAPRATATPAAPAAAKTAPAASGPRSRAAVVRGTGSCLTVRERPSLDAPIADCLPDGTDVPLTEAQQEAGGHTWREVEGMGWASAAYLTRTRAVVTGTGDCLNVRERPSVEALVLGCVPDGTAVSLADDSATGEHFTWSRIGATGAAETGGWVAAAYLD